MGQDFGHPSSREIRKYCFEESGSCGVPEREEDGTCAGAGGKDGAGGEGGASIVGRKVSVCLRELFRKSAGCFGSSIETQGVDVVDGVLSAILGEAFGHLLTFKQKRDTIFLWWDRRGLSISWSIISRRTQCSLFFPEWPLVPLFSFLFSGFCCISSRLSWPGSESIGSLSRSSSSMSSSAGASSVGWRPLFGLS